MGGRVLALASVLALSGSATRVQAQAHPSRFNTPTNQSGMYANSPVLRFNNPLNQAGMYACDPGLRFNNPLNQAGMYNNDAVLRFNNPTNLPGAVDPRTGNPIPRNPGNTGANFGGTGSVVGGGGFNNGFTPGFGFPVGGGFGGVGFGGYYPGFAVGNPGLYTGSAFGWGTNAPVGGGGFVGNNGFPVDPFAAAGAEPGPGRGETLAGSGKNDAGVSSVLNGSSGPRAKSKARTKGSTRSRRSARR